MSGREMSLTYEIGLLKSGNTSRSSLVISRASAASA